MKLLGLMTTIFAVAACHPSPRATQAPASSTAAELASRRAQMLGWLHDYTEAGQFPTDAAGLPRSVFVDDKGVRCPMAELIFRSGHADLVEAVAREHDAVRLAQVTEGPLHDWMLGSGLTMDEIDLIQGAADIDISWMPIQDQPSTASIVASAEVRGRLESAEKSIRNGTAHSLKVAVVELPNGRIPTPKIEGKVVPIAAMSSGPMAPPLRSPAVVRTKAALLRSLGTMR